MIWLLYTLMAVHATVLSVGLTYLVYLAWDTRPERRYVRRALENASRK